MLALMRGSLVRQVTRAQKTTDKNAQKKHALTGTLIQLTQVRLAQKNSAVSEAQTDLTD